MQLKNDSVVVQYNESRPLVLACDASSFDVGAVLSQRFPDGHEASIAYFSQLAERSYSQVNKKWLVSSTS